MNVRPFYLPGSYLVLELTNRCNLRCRHCARSEPCHPHFGQAGFFPRVGVKRLLKDLERHDVRFDVLILFWLGEPLAHPEFSEILHDLVSTPGLEARFGQIEIHSNGSLLSRQVAAGIPNRARVPQRWHFTVDAATPETYAKIKGERLLERVSANVERLIRFKSKGGFRWPQIVLQFIVSDQNELEVEAFVASWQRTFARWRLPVSISGFHVPLRHDTEYIFLKSLDCPTPDEQDRQNAVYARVIRRMGLSPEHAPEAGERVREKVSRSGGGLGPNPCSGFWKSPVIGWDGALSTCTRDNEGAHVLGNVLRESFGELWFGDGRISQWRDQVSRGDYTALPICGRCFIPRSVNYTGITREEIARARGGQR